MLILPQKPAAVVSDTQNDASAISQPERKPPASILPQNHAPQRISVKSPFIVNKARQPQRPSDMTSEQLESAMHKVSMTLQQTNNKKDASLQARYDSLRAELEMRQAREQLQNTHLTSPSHSTRPQIGLGDLANALPSVPTKTPLGRLKTIDFEESLALARRTAELERTQLQAALRQQAAYDRQAGPTMDSAPNKFKYANLMLQPDSDDDEEMNIEDIDEELRELGLDLSRSQELG